MAKRSRKTEDETSRPELSVDVKLDELRAGLVTLAERVDALESAETARRELARKLGK